MEHQVHQAYRLELAPNNKQRTQLARHAGTRRFVYNWGLARRIEAYRQTGHSPNGQALHQELVGLKKTDPDLAWLCGVSARVPQEALRDLDRAFQSFWSGKKVGRRLGYPQFKSKSRSRDSFRIP